MTCIVGVVDNGRVTIGGDSAAIETAHSFLELDATGKVFVNGPFVIGCTTSFRMAQLLRYALAPPKQYGDDVHAYMCVDFVGAVRETLKAGGWAERTNEQEKGGSFLVGYRGRLFAVHGDYQVLETRHGYAALGMGCYVAMGSLHTTAGVEPSDAAGAARTRVFLALQAAQAHCSDVREPFTVLDA